MLLKIELGKLKNPLPNENNLGTILFDTDKGIKTESGYDNGNFLLSQLIGMGSTAESTQKYLERYYNDVSVSQA